MVCTPPKPPDPEPAHEVGAFSTLAGDAFSTPIIGDPQVLAEVIGRELAPGAFEYVPWGERLLVFQDRTPESIKGIYVPESAREYLACGWIISVGPMVGTHTPLPVPRDELIGMKILYGKFAGAQTIYVEERDREYASAYVVLLDSLIWGEDLSGPQWSRGDEG